MNALERGSQLFQTNMGDIPQAAKDYMVFLCKKYGGCGEVMLTALCHYAEVCEKLPKSPDVAYQADFQAIEYFKGIQIV